MADWSKFGRDDTVVALLRRGRERMAERCEEIAALSTPPGVRVEYRKALTGRAWAKVMQVPRPRTRRALQIYLHECAHIWLEHQNRRHSRPSYVKEYEAEVWSIKVMRAFGISVPRKAIDRARRYVKHKYEYGLKRAKTLPLHREALRFACVNLREAHKAVTAGSRKQVLMGDRGAVAAKGKQDGG
jgi:hypothetical protein